MVAAAASPLRKAPPTRPPHLSWTVRRPPQPGAFLYTPFLAPLPISQTGRAGPHIDTAACTAELINGHRAITPDTALRLAAYFGNEAAFWMQLQLAWDMHGAVHRALLAPPRPASRRNRPAY